MKIQLLSDLHLETHPDWIATPVSGADLTVLAGDIGSYQPGSRLTDADFGLGQFSPRHGWPTPVLLVPGNHEYDGMDFDAAHARLQASCAALGIQLLERETWRSPYKDRTGRAVRFMGTTLWTDFDALVDRGAPDAEKLRVREKAFRAANYYLQKTGTTRNGEPFLAWQLRTQGELCQKWLAEALNVPFDGTTVVVTHFAPSLHSADPRYGRMPSTAGFCNALDHLLEGVALWCHGHLHAPSHYVLNGCRVVANPLGYARKGEQDQFEPTLLIEV